MNIFTISNDYKECASCLDDKRLNKMLLETTQLLSAALHQNKASDFAPYKLTHRNHPCTAWVRESKGNFLWTYGLYINLGREYIRRFNKVHKCVTYAKKLYAGFKQAQFDKNERTDFVNCTPYKDKDIYEAYKLTLNEKWKNDKRPPKWTNCEKPEWADANV